MVHQEHLGSRVDASMQGIQEEEENSEEKADEQKTFYADYSKRGTAKCKQCKKPISKGEVRIGEPVQYKAKYIHQYYHVDCVFHHFKKVRLAKNVLSNIDKLEGTEDITTAEKRMIEDRISEFNANLKKPLLTHSRQPGKKKTKINFLEAEPNQKKRNLKASNIPAAKILYTNIDQMTVSKKIELLKRIEIEKPMIVAICEVKPKNVKDEGKQHDYGIPNYSLHPVNLTESTGRGIAIYTHSSLDKSVIQLKSRLQYQEACLVEMRLRGGDKLLFCCCYRSPTPSETSEPNNQLLVELLSNISSKDYSHVCIVGDFNYKKINWATWTSTCGEDSPEMKLIEGLRDCYLHQHVEKPTRRRGSDEPSLLDLVLTNEEMQVTDIQHHAPIGKSDHDVLCFNFHCYLDFTQPKDRFNFGKGDYDAMRNDITGTKWREDFANYVAHLAADGSRVEKCWKSLKEKVLALRNQYVPKSTSSSGPSWKQKGSFPIGDQERKAITDKNRRHRAWVARGSPSENKNQERQQYTRARNKVKNLLRKAKRNFEKGIAKQCKTNPKSFWSYTRSKLRTKSGIAPLLSNPENKDSLVFDDKDKADVVQNQFSSMFTQEPEGDIPRLAPRTDAKVNNIHVTAEMVLELLKTLKINKSCGPDDIHPMMLKELAELLASPVATLFNMSIQDGVLPEEWLTAFVSPIFKKGARNLAVNYRPISLTCILCKVLETIVRKRIMEHLLSQGLLSKKQHGFLFGRSTVTQLLKYIDECIDIIVNGGVVDAIYLDFWKAFDTVPHRRLLGKLESYGITDKILHWIEAFLTGRTQVVKVNGVSSKSARVISGIPQGSVLGPLLFVIFINDLLENIDSSGLLFADDTKLFRKVGSKCDAEKLQQDIRRLEEWSQRWLLKFNGEKCHVLTMGKFENIMHTFRYQICGKEMEHVSSEKDLGVTIDENLSFDEHISNKVRIANAIVGQIRSSFTFLDGETFRRLFTALVRPHLEYAQSVWSPHLARHTKMLENVQIRATKLVDGMSDMTYEERLKILKLPTLRYRRERGDMIEIFKHINAYDSEALSASFQQRDRVTRPNDQKLTDRRAKDGTNGIQSNSFYYRTTRTWNELPSNVVNALSIEQFKNCLDAHWLDKHYN